METINLEAFMAFCKTLEGRTLSTVGGKAQFKLSLVKNEGIYYTLKSTGKERSASKRHVERVLSRYTATDSLRNQDYVEITLNSSYILALIKLYLAQ